MHNHTLRYKHFVIFLISGIFALTSLAAMSQEQGTAGQHVTVLSARDYMEIEQLARRYALALDTCSNDGYDYADLYTDDGVFIDNYSDDGFSKGGVVRARGREQLARAAGGGSDGCKKPVKGKLSTPGDGAVAFAFVCLYFVKPPTKPHGASTPEVRPARAEAAASG